MSAEARLRELNIELPPAPEPKGLYKPALVVGNLLYTSGHLPTEADGKLITGRVGDDVAEETAVRAARLIGLSILATVRRELGSLDRVVRVVKTLGVVNSAAAFTRQPVVINGFSQLLADVFGPEAGVGTRSAIAAPSLPLGAVVEIEAVFEIA